MVQGRLAWPAQDQGRSSWGSWLEAGNRAARLTRAEDDLCILGWACWWLTLGGVGWDQKIQS